MASAITMSCVYLSFMLPNLNSSMHLPQRQVRLPSHVFQYTILYKLRYFINLNSSAIQVDDFPFFTMPRAPENRLSCRDQSFTLPVYTVWPKLESWLHDQWDQRFFQLWQSWKESLKKLGAKMTEQKKTSSSGVLFTCHFFLLGLVSRVPSSWFIYSSW